MARASAMPAAPSSVDDGMDCSAMVGLSPGRTPRRPNSVVRVRCPVLVLISVRVPAYARWHSPDRCLAI
eukprot:48416-Eustigmatos_ZCMA.PRE.1